VEAALTRTPIDPVDLTARLVRCPSVTPASAGALELIEALLRAADFTCTRVDRGGVANLFARWGAAAAGPVIGFNGHVDVVPPGERSLWTDDPFGGVVRDGNLWGRGAADMKSGVAAFVAAAIDLVRVDPPQGAIVVTLTSDEEGPATDGTRAILDWMAGAGERMDACIVGEPTCPERLGDTIKIGRRGSITAKIRVRGVQGHAAYPERAVNPLHGLVAYLDRLLAAPLDAGSADFDPSTLAITTIDTGNPASNVIPAEVSATLNIRFNDHHTGAGLEAMLRARAAEVAAATGAQFDIATTISGESFLTPPGTLSDLVAKAILAETGIAARLSTSGGTSDARFIRAHCPVVEFGIVGQTMHKVDESVAVADIHALKAIYGRILKAFFA
jgi:succinyl-diaminopimelate desuccinylase